MRRSCQGRQCEVGLRHTFLVQTQPNNKVEPVLIFASITTAGLARPAPRRDNPAECLLHRFNGPVHCAAGRHGGDSRDQTDLH